MKSPIRIQHWQLFIYLLIIPALFPDEIEDYLLITWSLIFVIYVLKTNEELFYRSPQTGLGLMYMRFNLSFSYLYFITAAIVFGGYEINDENFSEYSWKAWIILPLHFYAMFAAFYSLYFTAKSLASIELRRNASAKVYGMYIVALVFFPIGIWYVQPKINRALGELPL